MLSKDFSLKINELSSNGYVFHYSMLENGKIYMVPHLPRPRVGKDDDYLALLQYHAALGTLLNHLDREVLSSHKTRSKAS